MDDRVAQVLRAIAEIDIKHHPSWEVIEDLYRYPGIEDGQCIFLNRADVTLDGDRFQAMGELALHWICRCHESTVPDVESIVIEGRFEDGRPLVETIGIYRSISLDRRE